MACTRGIDRRCELTCGWTSVTDKHAEKVKVTLTEEQCKALFKRFDTDRDGRLSKQELQDVFDSLGSRFAAWRTWRALCHADVNGDGYISEQEFDGLIKYLVKHGYAKK